MTSFNFSHIQTKPSKWGKTYALLCETKNGAYVINVFHGDNGGMCSTGFRKSDGKDVSCMSKFGAKIHGAAMQYAKANF